MESTRVRISVTYIYVQVKIVHLVMTWITRLLWSQAPDKTLQTKSDEVAELFFWLSTGTHEKLRNAKRNNFNSRRIYLRPFDQSGPPRIIRTSPSLGIRQRKPGSGALQFGSIRLWPGMVGLSPWDDDLVVLLKERQRPLLSRFPRLQAEAEW
jgi:hypothetical protein